MCFRRKKKEEKKETIKEEVKVQKVEESKPTKKDKPAEKKTDAKKPVEKKPAENKPAEKKVETKKVAVKETKTEKKAEPKAEEPKQARKAVYRVVYDKEDSLWKIKKDGAARVIDSRKTKEEALARVQELSENQDVKFVVHKKDGKMQKKANLKLKKEEK